MNNVKSDDVEPAANEQVAGCKLCYFAHRLLDLREAEVEAVAAMNGISAGQLNMRMLPEDSPFSPLRLVNFPSDAAARAMTMRAVLVKGVFEVWGMGKDMAELKASVLACPAAIKQHWFGPDVSFKWVIDGFGCKFSDAQRLTMMNDLAEACPFQGEVKLTNPTVKIWLIVVDAANNTGLPAELPYRMLVAREIQVGGAARADLNTFALKRRRYLGPTSMDHELSFIMCNMAHVCQGSLVYDPFAGTGSILVSAAACGAAVMGADIDVRVIRDGKLDKQGAACNVYTNFKDLRLPDPAGLLRADAANPPWRAAAPCFLDAIICDPPYGVRAGGRKMVARQGDAPVKDKRSNYIPPTKAYSLGECLRDLLDSAARLLVVGGRLSYWMPDFNDLCDDSSTEGGGPAGSGADQELTRGNDVLGSIHRDPSKASKGENVPSHPCLTVLNNGVQVLSTRYIRRLVTMVKHRDYVAGEATAWREMQGDPSMPIDSLSETVFQSKESLQGQVPKKKQRFRGKCQ